MPTIKYFLIKSFAEENSPSLWRSKNRRQFIMEACYSSHYWARRFKQMGHSPFLIPAQHVTPFVRGNKNDHNDALAIAECSKRPRVTVCSC